jgi:hypothetical protein
MTTLTKAALQTLGFTVVDGKAVRVPDTVPPRVDAVTESSPNQRRLQPASPYRSKTESHYAARLFSLRVIGQIHDWRYEAVTLRLGDRVRFTPDFRVVMADGTVELHEVKGAYTREDARIKLQAAATLFQEYRFKLATYAKGRWTITTVRAA